LVIVKNGKTYRRPSARAVKNAAKNFYLISLISCRCEATLLSPKLVKVSFLPNVFKIYPIF